MDMYAALKEMQEEIITLRETLKDVKFRVARLEAGEPVASSPFPLVPEVVTPDVTAFNAYAGNDVLGRVTPTVLQEIGGGKV